MGVVGRGWEEEKGGSGGGGECVCVWWCGVVWWVWSGVRWSGREVRWRGMGESHLCQPPRASTRP